MEIDTGRCADMGNLIWNITCLHLLNFKCVPFGPVILLLGIYFMHIYCNIIYNNKNGNNSKIHQQVAN